MMDDLKKYIEKTELLQEAYQTYIILADYLIKIAQLYKQHHINSGLLQYIDNILDKGPLIIDLLDKINQADYEIQRQQEIKENLKEKITSEDLYKLDKQIDGWKAVRRIFYEDLIIKILNMIYHCRIIEQYNSRLKIDFPLKVDEIIKEKAPGLLDLYNQIYKLGLMKGYGNPVEDVFFLDKINVFNQGVEDGIFQKTKEDLYNYLKPLMKGQEFRYKVLLDFIIHYTALERKKRLDGSFCPSYDDLAMAMFTTDDPVLLELMNRLKLAKVSNIIVSSDGITYEYPKKLKRIFYPLVNYLSSLGYVQTVSKLACPCGNKEKEQATICSVCGNPLLKKLKVIEILLPPVYVKR